jgi:tetratricopeptide (TPR) repeat protein
MLTTKKWGQLPAPAPTGPPAARVQPDGARSPRRRRWLLGLAVLLLLGLTACEPPGARALRKGERLLRENRPEAAVEPLREAVLAFGTNAPAAALALNELGLAYHRSGHYSEAAQAYGMALTKDFNLFAARYNRGCLFLEVNNLPGAISELTTYTAHEPRQTDAWLKLGAAQLRARQWDAAERSFQQVLRLNPAPAAHAEALNNLGLIQAMRRHTRDAFLFLNAALKVQPNYPPALLNQAIIAQQQLNDRWLAAEKYRAYLAAAPGVSNAAALQALISQLEPPPRPAAVVPTNPPPVAVAPVSRPAQPAPPPAAPATSAPPAIVTSNAVVVAARPQPPVENPVPSRVAFVPTNPPPTPAATSPPPERVEVKPTPKPAAPEPAVQVITLPAEPQLKAGEDLTLPPDKPVTAAVVNPPTNAVAAPPVVTTPPPASVEGEPLRPLPPPPKPEKKSFVHKLNPLHWFGSKSKAPKGETETAAPPAPATTVAQQAPPPAAPPVTAAPAPPPKPEFPRYHYLSPAAPAPGDRAAAAPAFAEGLQAQQRGNLAGAQQAYRRAVAVSPDYFDAWFNLGVVCHLAADWPQALAADEEALAIKPADTKARYNFALALIRAGYPVDAATELEKVLAADPAFTDAHLNLASLYADTLGNRAKAREHYLQVLALAPHHPQAAEIRLWLANNR